MGMTEILCRVTEAERQRLVESLVMFICDYHIPAAWERFWSIVQLFDRVVEIAADAEGGPDGHSFVSTSVEEGCSVVIGCLRIVLQQQDDGISPSASLLSDECNLERTFMRTYWSFRDRLATALQVPDVEEHTAAQLVTERSGERNLRTDGQSLAVRENNNHDESSVSESDVESDEEHDGDVEPEEARRAAAPALRREGSQLPPWVNRGLDRLRTISPGVAHEHGSDEERNVSASEERGDEEEWDSETSEEDGSDLDDEAHRIDDSLRYRVLDVLRATNGVVFLTREKSFFYQLNRAVQQCTDRGGGVGGEKEKDREKCRLEWTRAVLRTWCAALCITASPSRFMRHYAPSAVADACAQWGFRCFEAVGGAHKSTPVGDVVAYLEQQHNPSSGTYVPAPCEYFFYHHMSVRAESSMGCMLRRFARLVNRTGPESTNEHDAVDSESSDDEGTEELCMHQCIEIEPQTAFSPPIDWYETTFAQALDQGLCRYVGAMEPAGRTFDVSVFSVHQERLLARNASPVIISAPVPRILVAIKQPARNVFCRREGSLRAERSENPDREAHDALRALERDEHRMSHMFIYRSEMPDTALVRSVITLCSLGPHPHLQRISGVFRDGPIAFPYEAEYGTLDVYLASSACASIRSAVSIPLLARDLFAALAHVHAAGFAHLNVDPRHIIVCRRSTDGDERGRNNDVSLRLADFERSVLLPRGSRDGSIFLEGHTGSMCVDYALDGPCRPPEWQGFFSHTCMTRCHGQTADIWSGGIVVAALCHKNFLPPPPWDSGSEEGRGQVMTSWLVNRLGTSGFDSCLLPSERKTGALFDGEQWAEKKWEGVPPAPGPNPVIYEAIRTRHGDAAIDFLYTQTLCYERLRRIKAADALEHAFLLNL